MLVLLLSRVVSSVRRKRVEDGDMEQRAKQKVGCGWVVFIGRDDAQSGF